MLVLALKVGQRTLAGQTWVTVLEVQGDRVRLGFEAPDEVDITREELIPRLPNDADTLDLVEVQPQPKRHDMTTTEQLEQDARRAKALGIPFNPKLPRNFDDTPNDHRPASHQRWWNRPYIQTYTTTDFGSPVDEEQWMKHWPSGIRYDVRCLDGGAWDRSTAWGMFATFDEAARCIQGREAFA
jgi:carbon storage regulator CsrA